MVDFNVKQKVEKSGLPLHEIAFAAGLEIWNLRNYINGNARWAVGARDHVLDVLEKMEQPGKYESLSEFLMDMHGPAVQANEILTLDTKYEKVSAVVFDLFKSKRIKFSDAKRILTALVEAK